MSKGFKFFRNISNFSGAKRELKEEKKDAAIYWGSCSYKLIFLSYIHLHLIMPTTTILVPTNFSDLKPK